MKPGYCFAAALGTAALALMAVLSLPTVAVGGELGALASEAADAAPAEVVPAPVPAPALGPAPTDSCSSGCCSNDCGKKKEKEDAQPVTIDVQRRCYSSKCETIKFPCSPILPNLFHGWKKTPQCSDGHCGCQTTDEVPCAKCGCEYLHKTLIVKIRHEDQQINVCPTCGQQGVGATVNYGAQPRPPQPTPAPEMVPAPRPAAPMPMPK